MNVQQLHDKLIERKRERAHIQLSNMFNSIERGDVDNNRHHRNQLFVLMSRVYRRDEFMYEYWLNEIHNLEEQQS